MAEVLALGAAKVAGAAGVGAALAKITNLDGIAKSHFSDVCDAQDLIEKLRSAHLAVDTGHREATAIWGLPLSLFDERSVDPAAPAWAVGTVLKAQGLVDEAAELGDLTDLYKAQIFTAERERRSFLHAPVYKLIDKLDDLGLRLNAHLPCLSAARRAFDAPAEAARDVDPLPSVKSPARSNFATAESRDPVVGGVDLPVSILETRGALEDAVHTSVNSISYTVHSMTDAAWKTAQQVAQSGAESHEEEKSAPVELSSYALQYV